MPTVDDVYRALEQSAAENALPVEFFARVIWPESRFDARAVSPKGAEGIAQFMPHTASWHGLADPFDPMESLSRDRWDKIDTPRAILASLPPTTVRCAHARRHDLLNGGSHSDAFSSRAKTSGYARNQSVSLTNFPPLTWKICTQPPPS